jgi:CheY-like chemotaxis protein
VAETTKVAGRPRLLIVEDCPDTAELIITLATLLGYETRAAPCGRDALEMILEFEPDTLLLDISLPDINGFELLPALRALRKTRVIAATGWSRDQDRARARALGVDAYLVKPFHTSALADALLACAM